MSEDAGTEAASSGPICPNCRRPVRSTARQEQITPKGTAQPRADPAISVTYCVSCGWILHIAPVQLTFPRWRAGRTEPEEVVAPGDEQSLEGQFQLRCKALIVDIRSLGFDPNVWVAMINELGAAGAARKLLADRRGLVATPWLVRRDRPDLTLEHELGQPRWTALFSEQERAEAARRLATAAEMAP